MITVALGESDHPCAIDGHQETSVKQAVAVEDFLPNQSFCRSGDRFLHLLYDETLESLIYTISVGTSLDIEYCRKFGGRGAILAKQETYLTPRPQAQQEH